jgi:hypothetical protein
MVFVQINSLAFCASPDKKPMDVYQENIKLNQEKAKAS